MRKKIKLFIIAILLVFCSITMVQANAFSQRNENGFFNKRQEGYFWYLDELAEEKKEKSQPATISPMAPKLSEGEKQLKRFKKRLETAKTNAIMNPSRKNIQVYLYLQKEAMDRASTFADQWRRVVWQTPQLNYALRRPTTNAALQTYKSTRFKRVVKVSKEINKEYGIYFFYKGSCPFCHRFAPTLKQYEKDHGLKVLAITLDGGALPAYPHPETDLRVARMLKVTRVPSVFLIHLKTRKIIPVTQGLISYSELQNRVFVLTKTKPGQEF